MIEFNKYHLGHEITWSDSNLNCKKCNVKIWTNGLKYLAVVNITIFTGVLGNSVTFDDYVTLLTCDEYIIKNIIE